MNKSTLFLCLLLTCWTRTRGDVFDECADSGIGDFVASWQSCQAYVYCDNDESLLGQCEEGEYFDSESGTCDRAENVRCFLDEVDEPGKEPEEESVEVEPTPPTIEQPSSTTTIGAEIEVLNIPPVVLPQCPQSDDPSQVIFMASNASCTDYYLCYHGHAMEMHCSNQLHFDPRTGQCDIPENVQCALDDSRTHKCLPNMTVYFAHPDKCSYFFYCIRGFLTLQQCPFNYGWDIERRSCVHLSVAKCHATSRRA